MSNLSGNYKINAGEVQGVDVVREQERRARLQLLDEIREPSPQPIFGEPVKVELEDETSRRIKNTLGDFTQVLINDNKNLLGIARAASSTSGHGGSQTGRNPSSSKRPPVANGMYKPSNTLKHPAPDKRLGIPRNKFHDSNCPPNSLHPDSRLNDQSWVNSHRKPGAAPSLNGSSQSGANPNHPSIFPNSSNLPSNKTYPFHGRNGTVSSTVVQAPKFGENTSSAPPPKRCVFRPSTLKFPERRPEKSVESPKKDQLCDLETILKEMKQAVPPPLTAIQTPRTEESGFPFPDDPKEEVLLNTINELKLTTFTVKSPDVVPQPPEPPKVKECNSRQNTPSPGLKKPDNYMPAVLVDDNLNKLELASKNYNEPARGAKEPDNFKLGKLSEKTDSCSMEPVPMEISSPCLETEKATELLESLLNESDKCISSSLQEDLEMSDSDDEVITEAKKTESKVNLDISAPEYPKSSPINTSVNPVNSSTTVNKSNMDVPQSVPSNSSSSESGDSDSDDSSSSESNDSDSSASSDASDADTPSKMWGLSNFFDETRRNHSPAFMPMDTSTNSSTAAVKEDATAVQQNTRQNYSLVDEDSVHNILREPIADPIPNFLELDKSVNIKTEILSPITSPLHQSGPSAPLAPPPPPPPATVIRGPRTPPSPSYSYSVTDEPVDSNRNNAASGGIQITIQDVSFGAEPSIPQAHTNKHSGVQQNSCDMREEAGKVQATTVKKRLSKKISEIFSPSPVTQSFEDDEPSASKGLPDVSLDKDENDLVTMTSSYSVPSETSESSHDNYSIKTRQKVSKSSSAKKSKTPSGETLSESGQKGSTLSKSVVPKFKHPTRTRRASTETKQLSKTAKSSTKSDQSEEVKKPPVKSDVKDKSSSEKKTSIKTSKNLKINSKNSVKIKKKPPKMPPKQVTEGKKGEVKRKKNKFHIENFLQSPTISQSESGLLPKVSSIISPSRDMSPIPDYKNSTDNKRRPSVSPARASRSPSRSSSKSVERAKSGEKLRRSTRCSERASSLAQAESSAAAIQATDVAKKCVKRTPKRREHADGSPIHVEASPLLSPIPHTTPIPMTMSECAIPKQIMVSIPLDKLIRFPAAVRCLESESKPASKRPQQIVEGKLLKKDSVLHEKSTKITSNKRAVSKDIKDKLRTDANSKNNKGNKCDLVSKKDKSVKALNESSSSDKSTTLSTKSKTSSSVNIKTSIKTAESKTSSDTNENKASKKRKNEDNKQSQKKKLKTYPEMNQDKNNTSEKLLPPCASQASTSKSKSLERCDSVSSLSSLGSQMSQRSSKEKRSSTASDTKKGKTSGLPVKHMKQEKEEKIKTTIKKEPGSPEKAKEKPREHDCSEKSALDPLWTDTSSQYCLWGDPCKEDSKGPFSSIPTNLMDSLNRPCEFNFDSLVDMKELKEGSNLKHNNPPIMPMDYYYTEGKKQRHLAEREKDPFLQTLKYFEATILFILTSQQREEYTKEPDSVYQFYRETLNFSNLILQNVRIQHSSPGTTEFKLLILLLRCQALLHVKLYNLKLKEIKENQKSVSEFFLLHCPSVVRSLTHSVPSNPRMNLINNPSSHSPTPSPASSVNSQTSGYSSSDVGSCHRNLFPPPVNVTQSILEMICRQHTHLINLHMGHDLWEQADMYMTRSNLREFFKDVADQSENLTLHSSIKDLVNYVQKGISLVKKCSR